MLYCQGGGMGPVDCAQFGDACTDMVAGRAERNHQALGDLLAGGFVSGTALVVGTGAQTRWADIFIGLFVAVGVLLFAGLIEQLPYPQSAGEHTQ